MSTLAARRALLAAPFVWPSTRALGWPDAPVTIVVPFPAGGTTDILARILAQRLAETWARPVLVDNRGGAGGTIGTAAAARAAPDGYTLLLHTSTLAVTPALYRSLPFDVARDLAPVSMVGTVPFLLVVNPTVPAATLAEFLALAKARPGALSYASNGNGTIVHLAAELLRQKAGIEVLHVPYRGSAPAVNDLLAGQVQMMVESVVTLLPHVQVGRLRALAITGAARSPALPDVPTAAQAGLPGFEAGSWYGPFAAAATPRAVVAQVARATAEIVREPAIAARLAQLGADPVGGTWEEFAATLAADVPRWAAVVRTADIRLD